MSINGAADRGSYCYTVTCDRCQVKVEFNPVDQNITEILKLCRWGNEYEYADVYSVSHQFCPDCWDTIKEERFKAALQHRGVWPNLREAAKDTNRTNQGPDVYCSRCNVNGNTVVSFMKGTVRYCKPCWDEVRTADIGDQDDRTITKGVELEEATFNVDGTLEVKFKDTSIYEQMKERAEETGHPYITVKNEVPTVQENIMNLTGVPEPDNFPPCPEDEEITDATHDRFLDAGGAFCVVKKELPNDRKPAKPVLVKSKRELRFQTECPKCKHIMGIHMEISDD